jgi:hypothetical protein
MKSNRGHLLSSFGKKRFKLDLGSLDGAREFAIVFIDRAFTDHFAVGRVRLFAKIDMLILKTYWRPHTRPLLQQPQALSPMRHQSE